MTLKPWREAAVPHADVLRGTFQQAEFAADISQVHEGRASEEYQDPVRFFARTFVTEGMRLLLDSVVKRLTGNGGDPVIQLQTAFGGGKTHTLLAVYHLATANCPASDLAGISPILDAAGVTEQLPRARLAVLDGVRSSPNQPITRDGREIRTLWGDLAWQLGGADGYALVANADASGTSPGKAVLSDLLSRFAPCVILVDELVAYIRQFEEGKILTGGTYDANLSFVQALTEALKTVPTAVMLASLPESEKEAGSQRGVRALATLSHYFGRVHALWKPVAAEEAFEIVRRRLFEEIRDQAAADLACRAFADLYLANSDDFPAEVRESRYLERLQRAYPIHPEIFDRLYTDWSSLENFQRTRGVLKLMAKVIHRLWKDNDKDPLIMPGSLPLHDADTCNEAIYHLPPGWDPVIEHDILKEPDELEKSDPRLGSIQACRRATRAIFLGSAPTTASQQVRGIDRERILLGVVLPNQQPGFYADALRRLVDKLHYLNHANDRYWFDTRPNLRREMEERKRRFELKEHVLPELRSWLQKAVSRGQAFDGVHVFTGSGDVPDDGQLRLVLLPPSKSYHRPMESDESSAAEAALEILKKRGDQPRFYQNRILFLAAATDSVSRLRDITQSYLAWEQIVEDIKDGKLNLDQLQARQAGKSLEDAKATLSRMLREAYKWLLAPMQDAQPDKGVSALQWEVVALNTGPTTFTQEIERTLKENELMISEWAPIHLATILKTWFWKDETPDTVAINVWKQMGQQPYLPRLRNESVFHKAVEAGLRSRDFFAVAQGKEGGEYIGMAFGNNGQAVLDSSLLLVSPHAAAAQEEASRPSEPPNSPTQSGDAPMPAVGHAPSAPTGGTGTQPTAPSSTPSKTRFYGTVDLSTAKAKQQFVDIFDDVVKHLESHDINLTLSLEINAESEKGFSENLQRIIRTNCQGMGFKSAEFDS